MSQTLKGIYNHKMLLKATVLASSIWKRICGYSISQQ
jgi:hypothetical protein